MKHPQRFFLLCVVLLVAVFLAGVQFWIKPAIEAEVTVLINESLKAQGLTPTSPVQATVSPFTRKLLLPAFDLAPNPATGLQKGHVKPSETIMTYQGLLAFSPLRELFTPKSGNITFVQQSLCQGLTMEINGASVSLETLTAREVGLDAEKFRELLADPNAKGKYPKLSLQLLRIDRCAIKVQAGDVTLAMGPMTFEKMSPQRLEHLTIENLEGLEKGHKKFHSSRLVQDNIRIFTEEETLALVAKLTMGNDEARAEELLKLFIGDQPLVEKTSLQGLTLDVDGSPVNLKEISFSTKAGKEERFTVSGLVLAGKTIEEQLKEKLPIPALLHLSLSLGERKESEKTRKLSASLGIDELFSLDLELSADLDTLENLFDKLQTCPLHNVNLTYTDKSLLARATLYAAPQMANKEFLIAQITSNLNGSPFERDLAAKLCSFVEKPGRVNIASVPGKTFTATELTQLQDTDLGKFLQLTVTQGSEDLNQSILRLKSE